MPIAHWTHVMSICPVHTNSTLYRMCANNIVIIKFYNSTVQRYFLVIQVDPISYQHPYWSTDLTFPLNHFDFPLFLYRSETTGPEMQNTLCVQLPSWCNKPTNVKARLH